MDSDFYSEISSNEKVEIYIRSVSNPHLNPHHDPHVRHTAFVMDLSLVSNDATCDSTLTRLAGAADVVTEVHFKKRLDCHIFLINYIVPNSSMLAHLSRHSYLFIYPPCK